MRQIKVTQYNRPVPSRIGPVSPKNRHEVDFEAFAGHFGVARVPPNRRILTASTVRNEQAR